MWTTESNQDTWNSLVVGLAQTAESAPDVIFLDAGGTLFGVRDSVGVAYGAIAQQFGVDADAATLNQAFMASFKAAPPMAFGGLAGTELVMAEFNWWFEIARATFQRAGVLTQFADFSAFFTTLYDHFATADPWFVYDDVWPVLDQWRSRGIQLGIISNFDSRLEPLLAALGLANYFDSVTFSTAVGEAKPNAAIFHHALQHHDCPPDAAWHIGDSFREDYQGATVAGLRGIWLQR